MAIQQKAPAQQELSSSEDTLKYKLSLKSAKKTPTTTSGTSGVPVRPQLRADLTRTALVFTAVIGLLVLLYLRLQ